MSNVQIDHNTGFVKEPFGCQKRGCIGGIERSNVHGPAETCNMNSASTPTGCNQPEVHHEYEAPSLFDYLEAAYGVERAESLTIGIQENIEAAGSKAATIIANGPPVAATNSFETYDLANEVESLIDAIELDVLGTKSER